MEWTSIAWTIGLILAAPILGSLSTHLDHGQHQALIATAATAIGAIFCLPAGFFKTVWIFPPYIAAIVIASMVASSIHTRQLGLMVRGFTGPFIEKQQFNTRRIVSGRLSLFGTAFGSLGSAIFSSFTYHMLREKEQFISLWVVSIFSGLKWLVGILHFFISFRPSNNNSPTSTSTSISKIHHVFSILKFPHAIGSLVGVFLYSLTTMCIFTSGVLYLVGELCLRPKKLLYFWLTYFLVPLISMPLLHLLQHVIKTNAVKMQFLGFLLSTLTSGMGFYFKDRKWETKQILSLAAIQSISTGLLHAFGRVLLLDCSPYGKEGTFSTWYVWVKVMGSVVGFAFASALPGKLGTAFGVAFCSSVVAIVILIMGNVTDFGGAIAAGHVKDGNYQLQGPSSVHGDDEVIEIKQAIQEEL